jgi:aspartyl-tRNA(Asn)/glutamyl-tRNA(Gln) amidotransferase subunit C
MISFEEVDNLAKLARISMSKEEKKTLQSELLSILNYIDEIKSVTDEAKPVISNHRNIMREDKEGHAPGLYTEAILAEAPNKKDGYFVVKKIIESKK